MKDIFDTVRITKQMPEYPQKLLTIHDPPRELYCRGDISLLNSISISIVGSRSTNTYGRSSAVRFAKEIAASGVTVVSGMARGIDTCAHRGALDAGGKTVAVMGCGIDICYPRENEQIKKEIERTGLVISEYPPDRKPERYFFPQRNRIISGLAEAVLVIQAGTRSGSLITAECAADQGIEVCALPGNIDSEYNIGSNKLIRDGASAVLSPADILQLAGVETACSIKKEKILGSAELKIYKILKKNGEMRLDELCTALQRPPSYVAGIVTVMEVKGVVFSDLGKIFIAKA